MRKRGTENKQVLIGFRYHGEKDLGSPAEITERFEKYLRTIGAKNLEVLEGHEVPHCISSGEVLGNHGESYFSMQVTRTTIPHTLPLYTGKIESSSPRTLEGIDPFLTHLLTNLKKEGFLRVQTPSPYQ